ncbi:MAG: hypothetical protein DYH13_03160 [Alphaproteobacteria bacterium PRO2]|nr:hypothetical protein [Alphaproteobacteria bacterium PRO2]
MKTKLIKHFPDEIEATLQQAADFFKKRDYLKCAELAFTALRALPENDARRKKAEKMLRGAAGKDKAGGNKILGEYYLFQARYNDALAALREALYASPGGKARADLFLDFASVLMADAMDGPRHKKRAQLERAEEYCHAAMDNGGTPRKIYSFLMYLQGLKNDPQNSRLYARKILNGGDDDDMAKLARQRLRCIDNTPPPQATIWAKPLPLMN